MLRSACIVDLVKKYKEPKEIYKNLQAEKWRAFGWHAIEIDGHDLPSVRKALCEAESTKGKPTCIVAHTIKGKGVSFMENNPKFHGMAPTPAEVELALQELR